MEVCKKTNSNTRWSLAFFKFLAVTFLILLLRVTSFAQVDTTLKNTDYDSVKKDYDSAANRLYNNIKKFGVEEQKKNALQYTEDTIATTQEGIIKQIRQLTLEAQNHLEGGLDTAGLNNEINKIQHWYEITSDGVFTKSGTLQTHRNLETSYKIMRELLTRILARKSSLDEYYQNLVTLRNNIDSLYQDPILYKLSSDSAVLMRYAEKLTVVSQEIKPIDSAFKQTLTSVAELQPGVNMLVNHLSAGLEQIEIFQQNLSAKTFNRETNNLSEPAKFVRSFDEIINFSMIKAWLSFIFYARNETGKLVLMLLIILASTAFLVKLKRSLRKQNMLSTNKHDQLVLRYPFLSALVIVLNIYQFIFTDPPFILTALLWTVAAVSLTIIFTNYLTRFWMAAWVTLFLFFLAACADSLILQASRPERWIMLWMAVAGIICCSTILIAGRKRELRERLVIYFIAFVVLMQIASIFTNTYGRYNLSKTCLTAGFFNVVLAIMFYSTLRFINEALALATQAYRIPGKKIFFINFQHVPDKAPRVLYALLFFGWFVLFARNFYAYKLISVPVSDFLTERRSIGEFSFTIGSLLEVLLILYLSGLVSRIVAFFAAPKQDAQSGIAEKGGVGSWLLIIRIAIASIGLLLAFAAMGIPMDRLTIILSALSVGVGFGLQSLVNNLVSGLIISFEKPVNVGDIVEVGERTGTIKSIGFRSSILATPAGSNVVIPNGTLLDEHLVNWTQDNTFKVVEIPIAVAYGTDLEKAIQILRDLPPKDERILRKPAPEVIVKQFNASSIEMELSFWVHNLRQWPAVKSDMILAIDHAFKENNIKIPFPQQDLHIRSLVNDGLNKKTEIVK
jgi:potassium efflux system protein